MARTIHTEIEIDATPEQVWEVLGDLREIPNWNDTIKKMDGDTEVGAKVEAQFKMLSGKLMNTTVTVATVEPNKHVSWTGGIPVVLMGSHGFQIEALDGGRSKVIHYEHFKGLMTFLLTKMFDSIEGIYAADNERLKKYVEGKLE